MVRTKVRVFIGGLALTGLIGLIGLIGCETYEFPPRLLGVATDDCSDCEVLELSETRLPPGDATLTARFAFQDERGSLEEVTVFVTSPSGGPILDIPCDFFVDLSEQVAADTCELTALQFRDSDDTVSARLSGIERGELTARFGLALDEVGTWTVEVEAIRDTGAISNRLSQTFEVAEPDVDPG